ncbi:MAG: hypothetical protein GOVbin2833_46 [Prokaryotic dsDNA virus sp.]|nr:MAG: hypothetical protein GOVbin2833_46 [Prokaryotic dsDNA virus sp.]|tara:strand:- start:36263 stop:41041 length:4779 start_codon:yes stop_codon:yes gene_type:complete
MAKEKKPVKNVSVEFPSKGIHQGGPHARQMKNTTFDAKNVLAFDGEEGRLRGGRRPGLVKKSLTTLQGLSFRFIDTFNKSAVSTTVDAGIGDILSFRLNNRPALLSSFLEDPNFDGEISDKLINGRCFPETTQPKLLEVTRAWPGGNSTDWGNGVWPNVKHNTGGEEVVPQNPRFADFFSPGGGGWGTADSIGGSDSIRNTGVLVPDDTKNITYENRDFAERPWQARDFEKNLCGHGRVPRDEEDLEVLHYSIELDGHAAGIAFSPPMLTLQKVYQYKTQDRSSEWGFNEHTSYIADGGGGQITIDGYYADSIKNYNQMFTKPLLWQYAITDGTYYQSGWWNRTNRGLRGKKGYEFIEEGLLGGWDEGLYPGYNVFSSWMNMESTILNLVPNAHGTVCKVHDWNIPTKFIGNGKLIDIDTPTSSGNEVWIPTTMSCYKGNLYFAQQQNDVAFNSTPSRPWSCSFTIAAPCSPVWQINDPEWGGQEGTDEDEEPAGQRLRYGLFGNKWTVSQNWGSNDKTKRRAELSYVPTWQPERDYIQPFYWKSSELVNYVIWDEDYVLRERSNTAMPNSGFYKNRKHLFDSTVWNYDTDSIGNQEFPPNDSTGESGKVRLGSPNFFNNMRIWNATDNIWEDKGSNAFKAVDICFEEGGNTSQAIRYGICVFAKGQINPDESVVNSNTDLSPAVFIGFENVNGDGCIATGGETGSGWEQNLIVTKTTPYKIANSTSTEHWKVLNGNAARRFNISSEKFPWMSSSGYYRYTNKCMDENPIGFSNNIQWPSGTWIGTNGRQGPFDREKEGLFYHTPKRERKMYNIDVSYDGEYLQLFVNGEAVKLGKDFNGNIAGTKVDKLNMYDPQTNQNEQYLRTDIDGTSVGAIDNGNDLATDRRHTCLVQTVSNEIWPKSLGFIFYDHSGNRVFQKVYDTINSYRDDLKFTHGGKEYHIYFRDQQTAYPVVNTSNYDGDQVFSSDAMTSLPAASNQNIDMTEYIPKANASASGGINLAPSLKYGIVERCATSLLKTSYHASYADADYDSNPDNASTSTWDKMNSTFNETYDQNIHWLEDQFRPFYGGPGKTFFAGDGTNPSVSDTATTGWVRCEKPLQLLFRQEIGGDWLRTWYEPYFVDISWKGVDATGNTIKTTVALGRNYDSGNSESTVFLSQDNKVFQDLTVTENAKTPTGNRIDGQPFLGHYYFADGKNWSRVNPDDFTVEDWWQMCIDAGESSPQLPGGNQGDAIKPSLISSYMSRLVLSGKDDEPNNWWMSATADPYRWNTGDNDGDGDPSNPVSGNSTGLAEIGDPITCIFPKDGTKFVFGCSDSIYVLTDDPFADGSTMQALSRDIGILGQNSYCYAPNKTLYFFGSDGLYRVTPNEFNIDQTNKVNMGKYDREFLNLPLGTYDVNMVYDINLTGIHIFLIPLFDLGTKSMHYFYDERADAFWKQEYPSGYGPSYAHFYPDKDNDRRGMLIGGWDGWLRTFDNNALHDDQIPIDSYVWIGPLLVDEVTETKLVRICSVLDKDSPSVNYDIYVGDTAEEAKHSSPVISKTWGSGRNLWDYTRARGQSIFVKIHTNESALPWSLESITATLAVAGNVRNRSS